MCCNNIVLKTVCRPTVFEGDLETVIYRMCHIGLPVYRRHEYYISELRKTLWRYVAMFVLWRFYIVLYYFYVILYSFRLLYRFTSLSVVYLCTVCLISDDNQFTISDTTQFIDYYTQLSNILHYLYSLSGLLCHVSTVSKTWCLPACVRDPACNRDPASISTICFDPRPVSGSRVPDKRRVPACIRDPAFIRTRLLSGDLRYPNLAHSAVICHIN